MRKGATLCLYTGSLSTDGVQVGCINGPSYSDVLYMLPRQEPDQSSPDRDQSIHGSLCQQMPLKAASPGQFLQDLR